MLRSDISLGTTSFATGKDSIKSISGVRGLSDLANIAKGKAKQAKAAKKGKGGVEDGDAESGDCVEIAAVGGKSGKLRAVLVDTNVLLHNFDVVASVGKRGGDGNMVFVVCQTVFEEGK